MMNHPNKPEKKERKRKIKDHNAEKKARPSKKRRVLTPRERAEFDRQMRGFAMFLEGLLLIAGVDLEAMIREHENQFPSEIDVDGKGEGKP